AARAFVVRLAASTNCFSLPYSRRRTFEVRKTPCSRASSGSQALRNRQTAGVRAPPPLETPVNPPHVVGNIGKLSGHRPSSSPSLGKRQTLATSARPSHAGLPKPHGTLRVPL